MFFNALVTSGPGGRSPLFSFASSFLVWSLRWWSTRTECNLYAELRIERVDWERKFYKVGVFTLHESTSFSLHKDTTFLKYWQKTSWCSWHFYRTELVPSWRYGQDRSQKHKLCPLKMSKTPAGAPMKSSGGAFMKNFIGETPGLVVRTQNY